MIMIKKECSLPISAQYWASYHLSPQPHLKRISRSIHAACLRTAPTAASTAACNRSRRASKQISSGSTGAGAGSAGSSPSLTDESSACIEPITVAAGGGDDTLEVEPRFGAGADEATLVEAAAEGEARGDGKDRGADASALIDPPSEARSASMST